MRVDAIELRIHLEGVLLPPRAVGSITVMESKGREVNGTITFPAVPGFRSEDLARARLHVFWSDDFIRSNRPTNEWPILCEGEIAGDSFRKSPASRYLQYAWVGEHVYWDQCRLYFYNLSSSVNAQGGDADRVLYDEKRALFFGNDRIALDIAAGGASLQNRIMTEIKALGNVPLPAMVRSMYKATMTSNFFFDEANSQLKLDQRFAVPRDDSVGALFADTELFFTQIDQQVTAKAGEVRMSQVLTEMLGLFRYQMLVNAQPRFVSGAETSQTRVAAERVSIRAEQEALVQAVFGKSIDELGIKATTSDAEIETIVKTTTKSVRNIMNLHPDTLTDDENNKINKAMIATADDAETIFEDIDSIRQSQHTLFLNGVRDELKLIDKPTTEIDQAVLLPELAAEAKDALAQFFLIPETDFAAIPRCNVIFPPDISAFEMTRDYLNEPTRAQTSVPSIPGKIQELYFAPESVKDAIIPERITVIPSTMKVFPPVILRNLAKSITSHFGERTDPLSVKDQVKSPAKQNHGAVDIGVPIGTEVLAYADGVVAFSLFTESGGNYIEIFHKDLNIATKYLHLSERLVNKGDSVKAGDVIAKSGNTGKRTTGPHLHFSMHDGPNRPERTAIDPEPYILQADAALKAQKTSSQINTENQDPIVLPQVTLSDDAASGKTSFRDYKYLTPEERVRGIVPVYDYSMDRAMAVFEHGSTDDPTGEGVGPRARYMGQIALSNFQKSKYGSRKFGAIPIPFNPGVACGFPGLIVDKVRSIIGLFDTVTHTISVEGSPVASTVVGVSMPRFWDEGDPYYWVNGKEVLAPGKKTPDTSKGKFPTYYLTSLVPTNSYETHPIDPKNKEPFGGKVQGRPVDELYGSLLGVESIPYFFDTDISPVTGAPRAFNAAIDGFTVDGERSRKTIVGYFYGLKDTSEQASRVFTENYTRRLGASEKEIMVDFLGASQGQAGYSGGPFGQGSRAAMRNVVLDLIAKLNENQAFLG